MLVLGLRKEEFITYEERHRGDGRTIILYNTWTSYCSCIMFKYDEFPPKFFHESIRQFHKMAMEQPLCY